MINPTGDALVAAGIKDPQRWSGSVVRREPIGPYYLPVNTFEIGLGVAVGAIMVVVLVL